MSHPNSSMENVSSSSLENRRPVEIRENNSSNNPPTQPLPLARPVENIVGSHSEEISRVRGDDTPLDQLPGSPVHTTIHHGCRKPCCMMIFKEEIVDDSTAVRDSNSIPKTLNTHLTDCNCKSCTFCARCKDCFTTKKGLLIHQTKMHQPESEPVTFTGVRRRKSALPDTLGESSRVSRLEVSGGQFLSFDGQSGAKPDNYFHQGFCKCNKCTLCLKCNFNFASRQGLQIHKSRIHPDLESPGAGQVEHLS